MEKFGLLALGGGGGGGGLPPVTSADNGKALSVSSGVAGWNSKAVPIPNDVSMDSDQLRHLVASPDGSLWWQDNAIVLLASHIMDNSDTYSLNDYTLLAVQSFLTAAAQNPGVFTAVSQNADFSTSVSYLDLMDAVIGGVNPAILFSMADRSLVVKLSAFEATQGNESFIGHLGCTIPVSGVGKFWISVNIVISHGGVDVIGFAMPTTMSQAPTLSGSYNSGTNTLNITGGA